MLKQKQESMLEKLQKIIKETNQGRKRQNSKERKQQMGE